MLLRTFFFFFCILCFSSQSQSQISFWKKSDTLHTKRRNTLIVSKTICVSGTLFSLNELWYKDYPRSSFQFKNDNKDWKQMDKIGHLTTAYYLGKIGMESLSWAGLSKKNQLIYGATLGFTFLTAVEVFDGFSKQWGASLGDVAANAAGTALLIGQTLLWDEQRIILKYSFSQTKFAQQRPETLGSNFLEQTLKDYNGQTYWLSFNIWSFNKKKNFPKWLNVAFGYGTDGMLFSNNFSGNKLSQDPYRQFYLSLDADLSKIKTKSSFLKTLFSIVNFIKIPAPTLEFNTKNGINIHYLYF